MKTFRVLGWHRFLGLEGSKLFIPTGHPHSGILLACEAHSAQSLNLLIQKSTEFLSNNSISISPSNPNAFLVFTNPCIPSPCSDNPDDNEDGGCYRATFTGLDFMSIYEQLVNYSSPSSKLCGFNGVRRKIGLMFTGQCSQYLGMGLELYETSLPFRSAFQCASNILMNEYGLHIYDVMYGSKGHLLDTSLYSQTSIFCLEVGLLALWRSFGVEPSFVLGPSAGGFAAAVAAGVITVEEGARLVGGRAKLINSLPEGGMTAVQASEAEVRYLMDKVVFSSEMWLDVAVINSENDIVIAGKPQSLKMLEMLCEEKGIKTCRLNAKQAFHSRQIDCILEKYDEILRNVMTRNYNDNEVQSSCCGYISGIDGTVMSSRDFFTPEYWMDHARATVNLPAAVNTFWEQGVRVFIELGPRPVLLHDAKTILGDDKVSQALWMSTINGKDSNWTTVLKGLGQLYEVQAIDLDIIE
ncbi:reducing polyketide synthase swnK-like isoform X3 [Folsomia candida]|uniref:reducing polyketide synthase swnK-like isoform X3 n=1 Tax=Folsomia candida TaxID=158441 RepID=UPI00160558E8|nr:reducing polyketide synthase swnK-like isoform X3 [Folsomia candida]